MKKKYSKLISVSHLSAYAADPVKFCQHKGRVYNPQTAKAGLKAHARAGKSTGLTWLLLLILIAIILAVETQL